MKPLVFALGLLMAPFIVLAQDAEKAVIELMNMARTEPLRFISKYEYEVSKNPAFLNELKKNVVYEPLIADPNLRIASEKMAGGDQNPSFPEQDTFCGMSASRRSGSGTFRPLPIHIVSENYTNVLNPDYTHIGIYFLSESTKFSLALSWSRKCENKISKRPFIFEGKVDTSRVDFSRLNTAANVSYMNEREKEMVKEINFARAYPAIYADIIAAYQAKESSQWRGLRHDDYNATNELIDQLRNMTPVQILQPSECVTVAAKQHGADQSDRGYTGHTGSDGSMPWDRIGRACRDIKSGNENLAGGGDGTARGAVISLLIDSGIPGRGHRENSLNPEWTHVGIFYNGMVGDMPDCWVQNYATF